MLKGLRDKSFYIEKNNSSLLVGWLSEVEIVENTAKVKLTFGVKMQEYLINLKKNYTQYDLLCILPMKSGYSIRMFELLRSINGVKGPIFDMPLEEIQDRVKVSYKKYADFRRRVIEQSVKEINQFTDLKVQWKPIKEGKKNCSYKIFSRTFIRKRIKNQHFQCTKTTKSKCFRNCNDKFLGHKLYKVGHKLYKIGHKLYKVGHCCTLFDKLYLKSEKN